MKWILSYQKDFGHSQELPGIGKTPPMIDRSYSRTKQLDSDFWNVRTIPTDTCYMEIHRIDNPHREVKLEEINSKSS